MGSLHRPKQEWDRIKQISERVMSPAGAEIERGGGGIAVGRRARVAGVSDIGARRRASGITRTSQATTPDVAATAPF